MQKSSAPSARGDKTREERPIKGSKNGQYDLNFIDWNNEWQAVADSGYDWNTTNDSQHCPIYGMETIVFNEIIRKEQEELSLQYDNADFDVDYCNNNGLTPEEIKKIKTMKMKQSSKTCPICLQSFSEGDIIKKFPCNHIVHDACIKPWLEKNSKCPTCRFDLKTNKY